MDIIEIKFDTQIPNKYKKYGWTNNIKALVANEYMHNFALTVYFMAKDTNTYFYILKRSINKGSSNFFKKCFELAEWNNKHIEIIQSLLWRAVFKNNYSVAVYLINRFKNEFNFKLEQYIQMLYDCKSDRMMHLIYKNFVLNDNTIKRIPFSVWCNIHDFSYFTNDRVMKFMLDVNLNRYYGIFNEKEKPLSLKEALMLFGYCYKPRNR